MEQNEETLVKWLALLKCPQFGIVSFNKLRAMLPEPISILSVSKSQLTHYPISTQHKQYFSEPPWAWAKRIAHWMIVNRIEFIPITSSEYPEPLKHIGRPPIGLFVSGNKQALHSTQIGFVGTRSPTAYGNQMTGTLINGLKNAPIVITSGLAVGIDGEAHRQAIENGLNTIGVMATGLQNIYPKRHRNLAQDITSHGCLVTEFLPDVPAIQYNFPRRNRIIAGLSKGIVVVEAALRSGSLISARYAMEENRDVFAVPGNAFSALSEGCNELIKQGAKPVTTAADIVSEYFNCDCNQEVRKNHLAGSQLLASVDHDTTSVDVIVQRSNLPVEKVLHEMLELEIQGLVTCVPGGYVKVST